MTVELASPQLKPAVGRSGFFTLAFGAIVGSGWVVVLGEWLKQAGPGGSALAFLMGGSVIILAGLCYGELAVGSSSAGGEFLYALETFGRFPAFMAGWYLTLYQVAVCAFEAIALAWLARALIPAIALPTAYTVGGTAVTWDALIIGAIASIVIATLHVRGAAAAIRFQNAVTFGFIAVSVILILCGFSLGTVGNLRPLFASKAGHTVTQGVLWTFATSAYFLNGWQASLHALEERRRGLSARAAVQAMIAGIAGGTVFYGAIILACSMAMPWTSLAERDLPASAAFTSLGAHGALGVIVLVAAIISLTKTWTATAWMGTRLLFAQGRHRMLPTWFAVTAPASGAPRNAVVFVTVLTLLGVALGRSAIVPIVDTLSICSLLSIIFCLAILLRRRRLRPPPSAYAVPGGVITVWCALLCASAMIGTSLAQPFLEAHGAIPVQWILLGSWGSIGVLVWVIRATRRVAQRDSGVTY